MIIVNQTNNTVISTKAQIANTFFTRFKGLMFRRDIDKEEALVISPCNNVHMFFMKFAIDVVFVGGDNIICDVQKNLIPGMISRYVKNAMYVIELPAGAADENELMKGVEIEIQI